VSKVFVFHETEFSMLITLLVSPGLISISRLNEPFPRTIDPNRMTVLLLEFYSRRSIILLNDLHLNIPFLP
jgi:hypothetical protein